MMRSRERCGVAAAGLLLAGVAAGCAGQTAGAVPVSVAESPPSYYIWATRPRDRTGHVGACLAAWRVDDGSVVTPLACDQAPPPPGGTP